MKPVFPGFRQITVSNNEIEVMTELTTAEIPKTVGEFFILYKQYLQELGKEADVRNIISTFVRILVPAWDGPAPKKARSSAKEIEVGLAFLDSIPLERLENASSTLEKYFEVEEVDKKNRWLPRCQLKKMVDWAIQKGFVKHDERQVFYRFKEVTKSRNYPQDIKLIENRAGWADRNLLGIFESDYVIGEAANHTNRLFPKWVNWIHCLEKFPNLFYVLCALDIFQSRPTLFLGNQDLDKELCNFIEFLINRLHHRLATAERDFLAILRFFGWLHRQKEKPLEELRLQTIIPFIKLKIKRENYKNKQGKFDYTTFQVAKITAVEDMEEASDYLKVIIDEYLSGRIISPPSKINYMKSFINLAKYIYKDETKNFQPTRGFKDIPLIESLRYKTDEFEHESSKSSERVIPEQKRMIPWLQVLKVVEQLRVEAMMTERGSVRHTRRNSKGQKPIEKIKRTKRARACKFQHFLIMAIYTAMPPRRPREYYELEIGRTLVEGTFEGGIFIPKSQMKNPSLANWWFHFMPQDYKTGNKYKEWWGKVPNTRFSDGKTLYLYIEEWLTKWRLFFKPNHNCLFTTEKGQPIRASAFAGRIERCICRFTGVRVNPHSLRHMFVTHLRDIGATEEQMNSASHAMAHSRKAQAKIYDRQELQVALEPSFELAQKIAESFFQKYKHSD